MHLRLIALVKNTFNMQMQQKPKIKHQTEMNEFPTSFLLFQVSTKCYFSCRGGKQKYLTKPKLRFIIQSQPFWSLEEKDMPINSMTRGQQFNTPWRLQFSYFTRTIKFLFRNDIALLYPCHASPDNQGIILFGNQAYLKMVD